MFSGATVAVSTRADFVVKGTVDLVLFGTEDGGEIGRCLRGAKVSFVLSFEW